MTETDLLNLARQLSADLASAFSQVIAITFAMIVGVYYFLNQAKLGLKVFAYLVYSIGMFLYFGMMLESSNVVTGVAEALHALHSPSRPTTYFLAVRESWVHTAESLLITVGFWILWLSVAYLLFIWRKADHMPRGTNGQAERG